MVPFLTGLIVVGLGAIGVTIIDPPGMVASVVGVAINLAMAAVAVAERRRRTGLD